MMINDINDSPNFVLISFISLMFIFHQKHNKNSAGACVIEVHFVPIARDRCSTRNLTSSLQWLRSHDREAKAIAKVAMEGKLPGSKTESDVELWNLWNLEFGIHLVTTPMGLLGFGFLLTK